MKEFEKALEKISNPNLYDPVLQMSIFEKVLFTPKSCDFIHVCIEAGADLFRVNIKKKLNLK